MEGGGCKKIKQKKRVRKLSIGATRVICLHPNLFAESHKNGIKMRQKKESKKEREQRVTKHDSYR